MQLHIVGRNVEVTPALKNYIEEKLNRLSHRDHHVDTVNVTLHLENVTHTAEATLRFIHTDIHATAESNDMYCAIDELADKLMAQVNKIKDKITDHHH
jgi:putative sigma-54 modulation protein